MPRVPQQSEVLDLSHKSFLIIGAALLAAMITMLGSAPAMARPLHHAHSTRLIKPAAHLTAHRGGRFARRRFAARISMRGERSARLARAHRHRGRGMVLARAEARLQRHVLREAYAGATGRGAQIGGASFYSGGRTAAGGIVGAATCAHRSLPFGTRVLVTNLANARQEVLTVNDRGPFARGRILDVSKTAAGVLGMLRTGVARIRMEVVGGPG